MARSNKSETNKLLGYPDDARLLIINADDFGMCHAVNAAISGTLLDGIVSSTTLMVPCPWALHAMNWLRDHPDVHFGVHLTAICDGADYRWGPLAGKDQVPSLVDETGYFYRFDRMAEYFAQIDLAQLEMEFRVQIEAVLAADLKPTHLDWHSLRISTRPDMQEVMLGLAREYGLALRVYGRESIERVQGLGLPVNDYDFLDSSSIDIAGKPERMAQLLRELPEGLSEWAVHPGLDTPELLTIEPDGKRFRQTDFDFLVSAEARRVMQEEGIIVFSYAPLQAVWQSS